MNSDKENAFHSQERGKLVEDLEMFRLLYENTPLGYQSLDIEGNLKIVNQAWLDLLGYSNNKEVVGRSFGDFITDKNIFKERFPKFKSCGITNNAVFEMIKKDGTLIFVSIDGRVRYDKNNNFIQTHCILNDITEKYKAEEALRAERDFSRALIQTVPTFFVVIDADGKTKLINDSMLHSLGYIADEVIGKDYLSTFVPAPEHAAVNNIFEQLIQFHEPTLNENRILTKDGRELLVEWRGRSILNENGDFDYFFGVGIDITERKATEEQLHEMSNMLNNILNNANQMAIATTDLDFRITYYNPMAEKLFGYSAQEVIGKTVQEMHTKEKVAPERFEKAINTLKATGEYNYLVESQTTEGMQYLESRVSGIIDSEGEMTGYALFSSDVTERMKAVETMKTHAEDLEKINRAFVGRELKMIELKEEIKELKKKK